MSEITDYAFTLLDETGKHKLSEEQRLKLMIALETEPYVETNPAGIDVLPSITSGNTVAKETPASRLDQGTESSNVLEPAPQLAR